MSLSKAAEGFHQRRFGKYDLISTFEWTVSLRNRVVLNVDRMDRLSLIGGKRRAWISSESSLSSTAAPVILPLPLCRRSGSFGCLVDFIQRPLLVL